MVDSFDLFEWMHAGGGGGGGGTVLDGIRQRREYDFDEVEINGLEIPPEHSMSHQPYTTWWAEELNE